jgi:hypothetical protein
MVNSRCFQDIESLGTKTVNAENLNKIDEMFTTICLQSEKKLKSQYHNWWDIDLIEWKHNLEACNRALRKVKRQIPPQEETVVRILIEKQQYISMFCQHTQNSLQLRHNMLREEIQKLRTEKSKNTKKINHLKHLLCTETIREVYRKLKRKTEPKQHNNIYLQVPTANNTHWTITNMDEIAQHIAEFNMGHFTQAEHTPFSKFRYLPTHIHTTSNVVSDESWSEQQYTQNAHLLANVPEDNRIMAEKFLRNISTHPQATVKDIITLDDWTRKIKKWKEKTTTSPSGLHLGHYKALLAPHTLSYNNNNKEKAELEHQQEAVLKAYMTLLNISLQ